MSPIHCWKKDWKFNLEKLNGFKKLPFYHEEGPLFSHGWLELSETYELL